MESELSNFYGAAAQTIPVLLLIVAVETTFLGRAIRSHLIEDLLGSPSPVELAALTAIRSTAIRSIPSDVPAVRHGRRKLLRSLLAASLVLLPVAVSGPVGLVTKATFVFGSLLVAVAAEAAAFIGLAYDPAGTARTVMVIFIMVAVGLLLIQVFIALALVVLSGDSSTPDAERNANPGPEAPQGGGVQGSGETQ